MLQVPLIPRKLQSQKQKCSPLLGRLPLLPIISGGSRREVAIHLLELNKRNPWQETIYHIFIPIYILYIVVYVFIYSPLIKNEWIVHQKPPFTKVFPIRNGWYGFLYPGDVSDESFLDAILGATVP